MLSKDFKEFIELLNGHNVRYLVVGGYAVAFHGYPRYTKDLDVWIELSPENADNIIKALEEFGFGSLGLKTEDFLESDQIIQLGYPPNRIDILTTLKEIKFKDCYKARIEIEIQGIKINFIDLENLKLNKRATGRPQDLADAENLE
jgi:predicted nucleotidyltransferase